jgi:DNA invertase Pin-like site-specific DNA recombinase
MATTKRANNESKDAVGYVRVSTVEQVEDGVSLAAQTAQIQAYATLRGLELVEVIVDAGVSGGDALDTRDGGARLLGLVKSKRVGAVLACKLDRLFRDAADCLSTTAAWDKAGVALHLLDLGGQSIDTGSAMGRMFLTMAAGFAEMERNMVKERTRAALAHKKSKGERVGNIAYGYQLAEGGVMLEVNQAEQSVIAIVLELRAAGMSQRGIAEELNARGLATRTGGEFMKTQIVNILKGAA